MELDVALLCDAASVRDGLLFIIGGGVTRIGRPEFPTTLGVQAAVKVDLRVDELDDTTHTLAVIIRSADGAEVGAARGSFAAPQHQPAIAQHATISMASVLPIQGLPLPAPGRYSVEFVIDDVIRREIELWADTADRVQPTTQI